MGKEMAQSSFSFELAAGNFEELKRKTYFGRGIVLGMMPDGLHLVQIYMLTGRSPSSRNRVLVEKPGGEVHTEVADLSKLDPKDKLENLIYQAMAEDHGRYIVSNGDHTRKILVHGFELGLVGSSHETDSNCTPRIGGAFLVNKKGVIDAQMGIIRKFDQGLNKSYSFFNLRPGFGYCLTTYQDDGDPTPSFEGEPVLLPLSNPTALGLLKTYREAMNPDNLVSIAVKCISRTTSISRITIWNKYGQSQRATKPAPALATA